MRRYSYDYDNPDEMGEPLLAPSPGGGGGGGGLGVFVPLILGIAVVGGALYYFDWQRKHLIAPPPTPAIPLEPQPIGYFKVIGTWYQVLDWRAKFPGTPGAVDWIRAIKLVHGFNDVLASRVYDRLIQFWQTYRHDPAVDDYENLVREIGDSYGWAEKND